LRLCEINRDYVILSFTSVLFTTTLLYLAIVDFNLFDRLNIERKDELFKVFLTLAGTQIIYSAISFYGNILIYIGRQRVEYLNNLMVLTLAVVTILSLSLNMGWWGHLSATSISLLAGKFWAPGCLPG